MIFRKAKNEESTDSLNPWQSIGFELLTLVFFRLLPRHTNRYGCSYHPDLFGFSEKYQ